MTVQKFQLMTLEDIQGTRFECSNCHSTIMYQPDRWDRIPLQCQQCNAMWMAPTGEEEKALNHIRKALRVLRKSANIRCVFQFELIGELTGKLEGAKEKAA